MTIKESFNRSIEVKQNIVSDEKLISTIENVINEIVSSYRNGGKVLCVVMAAVLRTHSIWQPSFPEDSILTGNHYHQRHFMLIPPISPQLQMIIPSMKFIPE